MKQELFGAELSLARNILAQAGCPWGAIQSATRYTPEAAELLSGEVYGVSTASHGGFYVGSERYHEMPPELRACAFPAGKGGQWFEEDCSWCAVALSFPELFSPADLGFAIETCRGWYPEAWATYSGNPAEAPRRVMASLSESIKAAEAVKAARHAEQEAHLQQMDRRASR